MDTADAKSETKPCEQVGYMPHEPHHFKSSPTDQREAWLCLGYKREDKS